MKFIALLLIISISWNAAAAYGGPPSRPVGTTVDDLRLRYPNARLIQVSSGDFNRICAELPRHGYSVQGSGVPLLVAQAGYSETPAADRVGAAVEPAGTNTVATTNAVTAGDTVLPVPSGPVMPSAHASAHVRTPPMSGPDIDDRTCNGFVDLLNIDFGDNDLAVVLFVVVGVVVVAAMVVYAGAYLVNVVTGSRNYRYWFDAGPRVSWVAGHSESGYLAGGRLSAGFVEGTAHAGVGLEVGYLSVNAKTTEDSVRKDIRGAYALAGPAIHWALGEEENPFNLFVELLAGITDRANVHVVSTARAGFSMGFGNARLGLNLGSMYLNLKPDESLVRKRSDFSVLLGAEFGLRF